MRIPLCEPHIDHSNCYEHLIIECLDVGCIAQGPHIDRFEWAMQKYLGVKHAIAVSSGTAALHLALLVTGMGHGKYIQLPSLSFISALNAIRWVDATPWFVDVEPNFLQMDTTKLQNVDAIFPVHMLGHPTDMDPIMEHARKTDAIVIEDACEALGSEYKGAKCGTIGDIGCFSFNGNKIVTAGGGGMLVTNSDAYAQKARYLANQAKNDQGEYDVGGFNYRMSNLQAAVGLAQFEHLESAIVKKRQIARRYEAIPEAPWAKSNYWLSAIRCRDARELKEKFEQEDIEARLLWKPLSRDPIANELRNTVLCLPSSVGLSEEDQQRVIEVIRHAL